MQSSRSVGRSVRPSVRHAVQSTGTFPRGLLIELFGVGLDFVEEKKKKMCVRFAHSLLPRLRRTVSLEDFRGQTVTAKPLVKPLIDDCS